jgi:hypothetical protein
LPAAPAAVAARECRYSGVPLPAQVRGGVVTSPAQENPLRRMVDFNSMLQLLNAVVAGLLIYGALHFDPAENEYMDSLTLPLGLVLALQTQLALLFERRRRDPFLVLLCFITILYYTLRVFTLYLYPVSSVFDRFAYDASDTNYALVFILVANLFLFAGLAAVRKSVLPLPSGEGRRPSSPLAVLGLLAGTVALTYFVGHGSAAPRAIVALGVLPSPLMIESMAMAYFFVYRRVLGRGFVLALLALIVVELAARTLWGSRSAMVSFLTTFIIVSLSAHSCIRFSRRLVVLGTLFAPLVAVLAVVAFAMSTYLRITDGTAGRLNIGSTLSAAGQADELIQGNAAQGFIGGVFARAGFLDFSAEVIAHRTEYSTVVNPGAYVRSFVDNIFSPGFDLFDQPKISNSLMFVYRDQGAPSKVMVDKGNFYQSDQLGIYGELYLLFGYGSLPVFFVLAYVLKRAFVGKGSDSPFLAVMRRVIVLMIFWRCVDSFGFDWTAGEMLPLVVVTLLYSVLFASRRVPAPSPLPAQTGSTA